MRTRTKAPTSEDRIAATFPSHEEIAARAYLRYEARGRAPGYDIEDWLDAEQTLLRERAATADADLTVGDASLGNPMVA